MRTKMALSCCCKVCGALYWSVNGTFPDEDSRLADADGNNIIDIYTFSNLGRMECGASSGWLYYWGPAGASVYRGPCSGTDSNGLNEEVVTTLGNGNWDIDDANEYIYWLGFQAGQDTPIYRRQYGTYPATPETVITMNYGTGGNFDGQYLGTFGRFRFDEPTGLIYMHEVFFGFPNRTFELDLTGPTLTDVSPYSSGQPRPHNDMQVAGDHLYGWLPSTNSVLARWDRDGTNHETIDTKTGGGANGFRGIAVSEDEAWLYTFRLDTGSTYDLMLYDLSDFSSTTLVAGACTSTNTYKAGPVISF